MMRVVRGTLVPHCGMDWRNLERFPLASGRWQCLRPPLNRMQDGEVRVAKALRQWHPFDPIIVATPESPRFAPPICLPEISNRVHLKTLFQFRLIIFLLVCSIALVSGLLLVGIGNTDKLQRIVGAFGACLLYFSVDYFLVLRHLPLLQERALFTNFVYERTRGVLVPLVCLLVVAGFLQLIMQSTIGGFEALVRRFGLVFSSAMAGDYWRYATGPFIHSGPIHWINNLVTLTVVAGIAGVMGKRSVTLHFLAYVILTAVAVNLLSEEIRPEALVGISGGIFGLWGWVIGAAFRNRNCLPQLFFLLMGMFALLSVGLSLLLVPKASNTAHISGLILGLVVGAFNIGVQQNLRVRYSERNGAIKSA